jgi:type II secretory pathway predicted ATPase ExeA
MNAPLMAKQLIAEAGVQVKDLAFEVGLPRASLSKVINEGRWPKRSPELRNHLLAALRKRGIHHPRPFARAKPANEKAPVRANAPRPVSNPQPLEEKTENEAMLRKQSLSAKTRAHFNLSRDPFQECQETADVYLSPDIRYVRETMMEKVRHGGFLAVVAESGAGKSTLREELVDRVAREQQPVIVIQPYVLAMEDNDQKGKTLKSQHIVEAIMAAVAPLTALKSSPEARFRQVHTALRDSSRGNNRHVLIIEEAHSLPIPTLKHLKRFLELKDGMKPLISIILLGQSELGKKLSEQNPEVREVVQRIEIVYLPPLDNDLEGYLRHRFQRVGVKLEDVLDRTAIDAVRTRLTTTKERGASSWVYPLAVHNVLAAAMNAAAAVGAPKVTGDIVRESSR